MPEPFLSSRWPAFFIAEWVGGAVWAHFLLAVRSFVLLHGCALGGAPSYVFYQSRLLLWCTSPCRCGAVVAEGQATRGSRTAYPSFPTCIASWESMHTSHVHCLAAWSCYDCGLAYWQAHIAYSSCGLPTCMHGGREAYAAPPPRLRVVNAIRMGLGHSVPLWVLDILQTSVGEAFTQRNGNRCLLAPVLHG